MTLFEYLTAGYVLILSFAVVRALSAFPHVLKRPARYWVHTCWLAFALANCLVGFWVFFSYRDAVWSLPRFALVLATPSVLYVYNSILVPPDAASVASWREYFFASRVPLFATGALSVVLISSTNYLVPGASLPPSWVILTSLWLAIYLAGLASERPGLHAALALAILLILAGAMVPLLSQPAPLPLGVAP